MVTREILLKQLAEKRQQKPLAVVTKEQIDDFLMTGFVVHERSCVAISFPKHLNCSNYIDGELQIPFNRKDATIKYITDKGFRVKWDARSFLYVYIDEPDTNED